MCVSAPSLRPTSSSFSVAQSAHVHWDVRGNYFFPPRHPLKQTPGHRSPPPPSTSTTPTSSLHPSSSSLFFLTPHLLYRQLVNGSQSASRVALAAASVTSSAGSDALLEKEREGGRGGRVEQGGRERERERGRKVERRESSSGREEEREAGRHTLSLALSLYLSHTLFLWLARSRTRTPPCTSCAVVSLGM